MDDAGAKPAIRRLNEETRRSQWIRMMEEHERQEMFEAEMVRLKRGNKVVGNRQEDSHKSLMTGVAPSIVANYAGARSPGRYGRKSFEVSSV